MSLSELVRLIISLCVARHRQGLRLHREYYRSNWDSFRLSHRNLVEPDGQIVGRAAAFFSRALMKHEERLRVLDPETASFLVPQLVSALLRATLRDSPDRLFDDVYVDEVCDLVTIYLIGSRPAIEPATLQYIKELCEEIFEFPE